jgi:DNA-binding CsgD family transcriptional regulator
MKRKNYELLNSLLEEFVEEKDQIGKGVKRGGRVCEGLWPCDGRKPCNAEPCDKRKPYDEANDGKQKLYDELRCLEMKIEKIHVILDSEQIDENGDDFDSSGRFVMCDMDREKIELLTKRELEVLIHIANGMFNKEIAAMLNISERTVKNHIFHIFRKIEVMDRTQAAVLAIKNGLVKLY